VTLYQSMKNKIHLYLTRFKYIPLIGTIRNYKKEYFSKDLIAALTVAVVVIPQSMAYALIAGVNPVYGLYTAIISTIFGSAFGSSKHLIAGPTNAIALLVAGSMRPYMVQQKNNLS